MRYITAVPLLIAAILIAATIKMPRMRTTHYRPTESPISNPLSGWAINATDIDCALDTKLVYAEITWRELEGEIDSFDFESFERLNHLEHWWSLGRRVIIRFIMDRPGEDGHMDIPDWVYEMTGGDGAFYSTDEGGGFSPNYANIGLRDRHAVAIGALGEKYNNHPGVAYIEVGSLGHDGEWRVTWSEDIPSFPTTNAIRDYIWVYNTAFDGIPQLMVRPFREVRTMSMGIYYRSLSDPDTFWSKLNTIEGGGYDSYTDANLSAMPDFWLNGPAGAHLGEEADIEYLLTDGLPELKRMIAEGHISYIVIDDHVPELSEPAMAGYREAEAGMGYRLWVRSARWDNKVKQGYRMKVELEIANDGVAPLYGGLLPTLALIGEDGVAYSAPAEIKTEDIAPGRTRHQTGINLPHDLEPGRYSLALSIVDPHSGKPSIAFAMDECGEDMWVVLGTVDVI